MVIGFLLGYLGRRVLAARTAKAEGVVTDTFTIVVREKSDHEERTREFEAPVIRFTDESGEQHRIGRDFTGLTHEFQIGDKVEVVYNPKNPNEASLAGYPDEDARGFAIVSLLFVMGGMFMIGWAFDGWWEYHS